MKRINWFVLGLTYFTLLVFGLADNARGPIFPDLINTYQLSDVEGSFFFFVTSGVALLSSLLSSFWLARLGAFRVLQVFSGLQGVALLVMGVAPSYAVILVGSALLGASSGGLGIAQNLLASESVPPERRRQSLSGLHCMYGISSLFAPLFVTTLYKLGVEWREIFSWIALGSVVAVVASLRGAGRFSEEKIEGEAKDSRCRSVLEDDPSTLRKKIVYLGLMLSFYVISEIAISTRLVLYARRDLGYDVADANFLLSAFFLLLFVGRLFFAVVHVPMNNPALLKISASTSLIAFSLGLLHHPAWLSLCGLTMSVFYPSMMAFLAEQVGSRIGLATAWCVTIQQCGLMLMHFTLGRLADTVGLGKALWIGPICLALVLIFLVFERALVANRRRSLGRS